MGVTRAVGELRGARTALSMHLTSANYGLAQGDPSGYFMEEWRYLLSNKLGAVRSRQLEADIVGPQVD